MGYFAQLKILELFTYRFDSRPRSRFLFFFHINVILERGVGLAVALPQPTADMKVPCDSGGRQARAYI